MKTTLLFSNSVVLAVFACTAFFALLTAAESPASGPADYTIFEVAVSDLVKHSNDKLKIIKELNSGNIVAGMHWKIRKIRSSNRIINLIYDPTIKFPAMEVRVQIKSYIGSPSSLVDELNKIGVPIENDEAGSVLGVAILNRDEQSRIEVTDFTGTVRELLITMLPKTYPHIAWKLWPSYDGKRCIIYFGGMEEGTPKLSANEAALLQNKQPKIKLLK